MSMISNQRNRLDPSLVSPGELERLSHAILDSEHAVLLGKNGEQTEIPEAIYQHLVRIVRMMKERRAIIMLPESETFTTQAAADFLGMSRQFLVNLLEEGKIPFHHVGSHRRVYFKDLLDFQQSRDGERRNSLDRLSDQVDKEGLYFADPIDQRADDAS